MEKRPLSITIIGWIFIAAGLVGLAYHISEINAWSAFEEEAILILLLRFLAIVGGVFLLRGKNWARWIIAIWLGYHVILSFFHSPFEFIVYGVLMLIILYFLFRSQGSAYFRDTESIQRKVLAAIRAKNSTHLRKNQRKLTLSQYVQRRMINPGTKDKQQ